MPKKKGTSTGGASKKSSGDLRPRKNPKGSGGGVPGAPAIQGEGAPGLPTLTPDDLPDPEVRESCERVVCGATESRSGQRSR
jgi:hypothetical protein